MIRYLTTDMNNKLHPSHVHKVGVSYGCNSLRENHTHANMWQNDWLYHAHVHLSSILYFRIVVQCPVTKNEHWTLAYDTHMYNTNEGWEKAFLDRVRLTLLLIVFNPQYYKHFYLVMFSTFFSIHTFNVANTMLSKTNGRVHAHANSTCIES